jgi:hypothetical protein
MGNARALSNALFLASLILISVPAAALSVQLKAADITSTIIGQKIHGVTAKGAKWNGMYKTDGTMEYDKGKTGTWRLNGDMLCDTPKGDKEYCRGVSKIGDKKFQMMKEDGSKGGVITLE